MIVKLQFVVLYLEDSFVVGVAHGLENPFLNVKDSGDVHDVDFDK